MDQEPTVRTRILILSDTHGDDLIHPVTAQADVAIHCGDLTEESKLGEFRAATQQLKAINAPLKLVIGGNHDFTLDDTALVTKWDEIRGVIEDDLITSTYGNIGEAQQLLSGEDAKAAGIVFMNEGTHHFALANGASLTVYANPFTPSMSTGWGFQYNPQHQEHQWNIGPHVDVVVTHGPPKGVLDYTDSKQRAGSSSLFAAVARAQPTMHCFGHIHEGWGAKMINWHSDVPEEPTHFTAIDNESSTLIANRQTLRKAKFDSLKDVVRKQTERQRYEQQGYFDISTPIRRGEQTLFVNASVEGLEEGDQHLPWLVEIDLPRIK